MQTSRTSAPKKTGTGPSRSAGHRRPYLAFGVAALAALILYLPTLQYGFVWDDNTLVVNNPSLNRTNPLDLFARGFWNNPETERSRNDVAYYRPLSNLSLYVDHEVWGLRPSGYHLTNVIINAAVVLFTCLLLWELFGSVWPAVLGGLLVGIHPAMNCVVTFVSNRTYLLALFFLLTGSYALLRGRRDRGRVWPVLFGVSLLLSTLALESSLVFAAVAAAWLFVNRTRYRKLRSWLSAAVLPIACYLLLRFGIARVPFASSVMSQAITEPLQVLNTFGQQLQLLLFPFNQKVIYVADTPFTGFSVYTVLGLLFLGLPLYAVIRLGRRRRRTEDGGRRTEVGGMQNLRPDPEAVRLGWYGYAWMVLFLLPFAHLVFLGPAGRMLYLAAPGAVMLLAALYATSHQTQSTVRVVLGAVLLYTAACAVQTLRRNPIWRDELSMSKAMVREAPGSVIGHLHYGLALTQAGEKQGATEQFRAAVAISPDDAGPHVSLAFALIDQGDLPDAIRELREVVRLEPESPKARNDLGVALMRIGRLDSAIAEYREALRLDPNSDVVRRNLAMACRKAGMPDSSAQTQGNQR
ncbi:MAG TPA: tetratricopeptide repeat protein [bacterium]|nr:tetratricopeptide repeat protein [bacterium]